MELPELTGDITPFQLKWEQVAAEGNRMKPHEEVRKYVDRLLNISGNSASQYQGTVDEWLERKVTVINKKAKDSRYGTKYTYHMSDAEGNIYVWETGSKDYATSTTVSLKMKVKEHKEDCDNKVTIVWYCKEI